jgi:hypothetical protein
LELLAKVAISKVLLYLAGNLNLKKFKKNKRGVKKAPKPILAAG